MKQKKEIYFKINYKISKEIMKFNKNGSEILKKYNLNKTIGHFANF